MQIDSRVWKPGQQFTGQYRIYKLSDLRRGEYIDRTKEYILCTRNVQNKSKNATKVDFCSTPTPLKPAQTLTVTYSTMVEPKGGMSRPGGELETPDLGLAPETGLTERVSGGVDSSGADEKKRLIEEYIKVHPLPKDADGNIISYDNLCETCSPEEMGVRLKLAHSIPFMESLQQGETWLNIGFDTEFYYKNTQDTPKDVIRLQQIKEAIDSGEYVSDKEAMDYDFEKKFLKASELEKWRIILSYQFAIQLDEEYVLTVFFINKDKNRNNRLFWKPVINAVMKTYHFVTNTRERYVETIPYTENGRTMFWSDEMKDIRQDICLVCSTGIADLTSFKDIKTKDDNGEVNDVKSFLRRLNSIQNGLVTMSHCFHFTRNDINNHGSVYYHLEVRDTNCFADAGNKSVLALGKELLISKVDISPYSKSEMDVFLESDRELFIKYAVTDSIISACWLNSRFGLNKKTAVTINSVGSKVMRERIADEMKIPRRKNGLVDEKAFDLIYRGIKHKSEKRPGVDLDSGELGLYNDEEVVPVNEGMRDILTASSLAYYGGLNACYMPGFYTEATFDIDMCNAYPTAMSICTIPDFTKEPHYIHNEKLDIGKIGDPLKLGWYYVSFEAPDDREIFFGVFPIRTGSNTIYPRSSRGVEGTWVTRPEVYLALQLGFKVFCIKGIEIDCLRDENNEPYRPMLSINKELVEARSWAKKLLGLKNPVELTIKQVNNGGYGNISMGIREKHTFDAFTAIKNGQAAYMKLGWGKITNPMIASYCTAYVRCNLIAQMQAMREKGYSVYSVTTDGFISNLSSKSKEYQELYTFGFSDLMKRTRMLLTGSDQIWEDKHTNENLLNICTRGNVDISGDGVLAHNSFISEDIFFDKGHVSCKKGSKNDRIYFAFSVGTRAGSCKCTNAKFANLSDIVVKDIDFNVKNLDRMLSMDYDLKSRILTETLHDTEFTIPPFIDDNGNPVDSQGNPCKEGMKGVVANFDTRPYECVEDFIQIKEDWINFRKQGRVCIDKKLIKDSYDIRTSEKIGSLVKTADMHKKLKKAGSKARVGYGSPMYSQVRMLLTAYFSGVISLPEVDACANYNEIADLLNGKFNDIKETFKGDTIKQWRHRITAESAVSREVYADALKKFRVLIPAEAV